MTVRQFFAFLQAVLCAAVGAGDGVFGRACQVQVYARVAVPQFHAGCAAGAEDPALRGYVVCGDFYCAAHGDGFSADSGTGVQGQKGLKMAAESPLRFQLCTGVSQW